MPSPVGEGGPLAVDEVLPARVPSVPTKVTKLSSANIALRAKRTVETPVPTKKSFALCKVRSENVGTGLRTVRKKKSFFRINFCASRKQRLPCVKGGGPLAVEGLVQKKRCASRNAGRWLAAAEKSRELVFSAFYVLQIKQFYGGFGWFLGIWLIAVPIAVVIRVFQILCRGGRIG